MDLSELIKDSTRNVIKEDLPAILNQVLIDFFAATELNRDHKSENDIIKISRVKDLTGYALPTIYAKVSRNEIPCLGRGRPLLFSKKHIHSWLQAGRPKTGNLKEINEILYTYEK